MEREAVRGRLIMMNKVNKKENNKNGEMTEDGEREKQKKETTRWIEYKWGERRRRRR